jgi:hypothetical protein
LGAWINPQIGKFERVNAGGEKSRRRRKMILMIGKLLNLSSQYI